MTEISIEDDGNGYSKDILNKIGEPYINPSTNDDKKRLGLDLGIFIGKTFCEQNMTTVIFQTA